jgi:nanoRNase/pAp phosphatase (c-di-AMP/oligoRNAs hydrolase)
MHPDPDALGAAAGMQHLLRRRLPEAKVTMSVRGQVGGGVNDAFARYAKLDLGDWPPGDLSDFDGIVLLDVQPQFPTNPLPEGRVPTAVIDHHRSRKRNPDGPFVDIRPDVGATASIVFSYFAELGEEVPPELAAVLLYAIESDLAGAAGTPSDLDTLALSNLTLLADTKRLYQMRNVSLPQSYFAGYAAALANAVTYGPVLITALGRVSSLEKPAVMADFLLRYDGADWVLVTALHDEDINGIPERLVLSLRTHPGNRSAGEVMRRLVKKIGAGGGHRTKAGGFINLPDPSPETLAKLRARIKRRLIRELAVGDTRGRRFLEDTPPSIDVTGGTATARPAKAAAVARDVDG